MSHVKGPALWGRNDTEKNFSFIVIISWFFAEEIILFASVVPRGRGGGENAAKQKYLPILIAPCIANIAGW